MVVDHRHLLTVYEVEPIRCLKVDRINLGDVYLGSTSFMKCSGRSFQLLVIWFVSLKLL